MTAYRFLSFSLIGNVAIGDAPLSNVRFGGVLNGVGTLTADVPINSATAVLTTSMTVPEKTFIVVERNGPGNCKWGGVIWTRRRQMTADGPVMSITCAEIASLWHRNRLVADLGPYTNADQFTIAQGLINAYQAQSGGNVGIVVGSSTCGVLRDRTQYYSYERANIGDKFDQLAAVQNGFDWSVDIGGTATTPTKTLNLSYPRRGRIAGTTGVVFQSGKNLMGYTLDEDGTQSARSVDVSGAGDGYDMLISTAANTTLIDGGYPLTSEQISASSVTSQATLDARALGECAVRAPTPTYLTLIVDPDDVDGGLGVWTLGDDALVDINDDLFPRNSDGTSGLREYRRIIAYDVSTPDSGKETVSVVTGKIT